MGAGALAKDTHEVLARLAPPLMISRGALDLILPILARLGQWGP